MKAWILLFLVAGSAWSQSGLDLCVQRPYGGSVAGKTGILSLSYYSPSWNRLAGFAEFGMVGMPSLGFSEEAPLDHRRTTSFVGLYAGHLFLLGGGFIRPGFTLGTVWEETAQPEWVQNPLNQTYEKRTSLDSKFAPYYAIKVQVMLFSLMFSNKGIGGGVNLTL